MNKIYEVLDTLIPNPKCELDYTKNYELLIATMLSAQSTDKRVNMVTKVLFSKYTLQELADIDFDELKSIIKSVGSFNKKAFYLKSIAKSLVNNYGGIVPNNRKYLESLPGVGRKTANVVLKNLYNVPCIPVDTHVERVSKRLGLAKIGATPIEVERSLMNLIPKVKWNKVGEQILLFGRYYCKSIKPECENCPLKKDCKKDDLK
ncbi:MAG: endonuclease III [Bacilli bacterium]|nr:endonuclease III [Bacilli bacterium]